jgi:hypothetical protein
VFRIEFYVDDKRLSNALRALTGVAIGDPKVQPVVNGVQKAGKVVAKGDGSTSSLWIQFVEKNQLASTKFKATTLKAFTKAIGRAPSSYGHFRNELIKAGVLRKAGGNGTNQFYVAVLK